MAFPNFNDLYISRIRTLSGLLIVKPPLSMRQLTVGAIITESLNTKPILLPILFSVASAHFCTLSTFSLPSITAISGQETVSRVTTSKSFFVIIALPSIRVPASSSTGYQPLILFGVEQPTVVTQITIGVS